MKKNKSLEKSPQKLIIRKTVVETEEESTIKQNIDKNLQCLKNVQNFSQPPLQKRRSHNEKIYKIVDDSNRFSVRVDSTDQNHVQSMGFLKRFSHLKLKKDVQLGEEGKVSSKNEPEKKRMCQNHKEKEGKFFIVYKEQPHMESPCDSPNQEVMRYCEQCAINLSQMDFLIRKENMGPQPDSPQQRLLDELFECQYKLSIEIEKVQENEGVSIIDEKIQEVEHMFSSIQQALHKLRKEEYLRLEMEKIRFHERIWEKVTALDGLKRKVSYLISDIRKDFRDQKKADQYKSEICKQIYDEILMKTKSVLKGLENKKMSSSLIEKLSLINEAEICERMKDYFSERTHELSFDLQEDHISEATSKNAHLLELSKFQPSLCQEGDPLDSYRSLREQLRI